MIIQETLDNGLIRTYSNAGFKVHGGMPEADYDVAYDPEDAHREYTETNIPVDEVPEGPTQYSKLKILMAARTAGFIDALIAFIESDKTVEYIWNASNVIEDNELLAAYIPAIAQALGKEETAVKAFLDENCTAERKL